MSKRIIDRADLKPMEGFVEIFTLPQNKFLLNPTSDEKRLVFLYTEELRGLRAERYEAQCSALDAQSKCIAQAKEIDDLKEVLAVIQKYGGGE